VVNNQAVTFNFEAEEITQDLKSEKNIVYLGKSKLKQELNGGQINYLNMSLGPVFDWKKVL
jgi:hypothetical protein